MLLNTKTLILRKIISVYAVMIAGPFIMMALGTRGGARQNGARSVSKARLTEHLASTVPRGKSVIGELKIEIRPGVRPTFVFSLTNGEAPAGLLEIWLLDEETRESVWKLDWVEGSNEWSVLESKEIALIDSEGFHQLPHGNPPSNRSQGEFSDSWEREVAAFFTSLPIVSSPLREVEYGSVPEGWKQTIPIGLKPKELSFEKKYRLVVMGRVSGSLSFSRPK